MSASGCRKPIWVSSRKRRCRSSFRRCRSTSVSAADPTARSPPLGRESPERTSIPRLDTDWDESKNCELDALYLPLAKGGILIIDDYGHREGARQAVDRFFAANPSLLLNRIGYAMCLAVKISRRSGNGRVMFGWVMKGDR